jgi:flagellar assembly protein FliH
LFKKNPSTFWEGLPALDPPRPASVPIYEYKPVEAEKEAQAILGRARHEASSIVQSATESAESLRLSAESEAEAVREASQREGQRDGYERAKQEVLDELSVSWYERVEALQSDIQVLIDAIASERKMLWEQTELEINIFVIEMAKKVVKVEITQNPDVIAEMIRHSLRRVADKDNIRIRVCPEELAAIRADRKDLLLVLDGARQLEIVDDRRISRGGCVIETSAGTVDARIETQFEQIADKLGVLPLSGEAEE